MKSLYVFPLLAATAAAVVMAAAMQEQDALIALDRQWGEAGMKDDKAKLGTILADDSVTVDGTGVNSKAEAIAANEPVEDANATYEAGEYQVRLLDDGTAVMTHSTPEHYSLHVWAKRGGNWQVVATASVPRE
jgi:hypothetical protein